MSELEQAFRDAVVLPDRSPTTQWAHEFVDFGTMEAFKGRYRVENVPWTRQILDNMDDPKVRECTVVAPAQVSGKTLAAMLFLLSREMRNPAKMAFNLSTDTAARKFADTKLKQLLMACPKVAEKYSDDRHDVQKRRIIFNDGSFLLIQGAEVPANRQSDSIEVQVNDELHLWQRPWVKEMHARTDSFRDTKKILNISLGGVVGSELHERVLSGNMGEWVHTCPKCKAPIEYIFNSKNKNRNIRFDLSKVVVGEDGELDLDEFEKSIYAECMSCKNFKLGYDQDLLAELNSKAYYLYKNPKPMKGVTSLHVNSFAIGRTPWVEILEPWAKMNTKGGAFSTEILRVFITNPLAEFWDNQPMVVSKELTTGEYTRADMLKPGNWDKEWIRVMAIDNQEGSRGDIKHRWFEARALARNGDSRLIDCGRLNNWEDVEAKRKELCIPDSTSTRFGPWTACDRAHDPEEVDQICHQYRWFGLLGQPTEEFLHGPNSEYKGLRMAFSEQRRVDLGFGTTEFGRAYALYYLWSSQKVQSYLANLRNKKLGNSTRWDAPKDILDFCPEYEDQMNSHRQIRLVDKKTGEEYLEWVKIGSRPDHLYDCECMILVLALRAGVIKP